MFLNCTNHKFSSNNAEGRVEIQMHRAPCRQTETFTTNRQTYPTAFSQVHGVHALLQMPHPAHRCRAPGQSASSELVM
eukprot:365052-Chlamydomonas_euryale.AAC.36